MNAQERAAFEHPSVMAEPPQSRRAAARLVELQRRQVEARERQQAIGAERANYAFDGVGQPAGAPAARALARLRQEEAAIADELHDLDSAIDTAEQRLVASRTAASASAALADARYVQDDLCRTIRAEAAACGDALVDFRLHVETLMKAIVELRGLNYGPVPRLVELQIERAIGTALSGLKLSPPTVLAPSNRVTMPSIAESICQNAEAAARRVINGEAA